eukprot:6252199-Alexandrium_andersonii.AAC.1
MSASLVGSEMCIRDRGSPRRRQDGMVSIASSNLQACAWLQMLDDCTAVPAPHAHVGVQHSVHTCGAMEGWCGSARCPA